MKERIKGCQWRLWHAEAVPPFCVSSAWSGKCYSYSAQRWPFLLSECSGGGRGAALSLLCLPRFLVPKQFEYTLAGSKTISNSSMCSSHWLLRSIPVFTGCRELWSMPSWGTPSILYNSSTSQGLCIKGQIFLRLFYENGTGAEESIVF